MIRVNTTRHNFVQRHGTCIILLGMVCVLLWACRHNRRLHADAITDRSQFPVLETDSVNTLISDSGITRYRIAAPKWQIFDKAEPSYWLFPDGIYLEKFALDLRVEASLKADYAKYLDKEELWELKGNVDALNEQGERFQTAQLFWNQHDERIWSDSSVTIIRESSVLSGVGFVSNQTMTNYTILRPTGYFPVEE